MSIKTWKNEFYPVSATSRMSKKAAIKHSIKKWEGLLPENLKKHGVVLNGLGDVCENLGSHFCFEISTDTCALCEKYFNDICSKCPLYKKLGFKCGKGEIKDGDGWKSYMDEGSPELMLKNLRSLFVDEAKK